MYSIQYPCTCNIFVIVVAINSHHHPPSPPTMCSFISVLKKHNHSRMIGCVWGTMASLQVEPVITIRFCNKYKMYIWGKVINALGVNWHLNFVFVCNSSFSSIIVNNLALASDLSKL